MSRDLLDAFNSNSLDDLQRRSSEARTRMEARRSRRTVTAADQRPDDVHPSVIAQATTGKPESYPNTENTPALPKSIRSETFGYSDDMGAVEANLKTSDDIKIRQCRKLLLEVLLHTNSQDFKLYQISQALFRLIDSLLKSSIQSEITLANSIASQWKQILDGTKTTNTIELSDLSAEDLKSLGIIDSSITDFDKSKAEAEKLGYVKLNADGKTFTLSLSEIPKIDISNSDNHYIYELVTFAALKSVLNNPSSTKANIQEVIKQCFSLLATASRDASQKALASEASRLLAEALSRDVSTMALADKIFARLLRQGKAMLSIEDGTSLMRVAIKSGADASKLTPELLINAINNAAQLSENWKIGYALHNRGIVRIGDSDFMLAREYELKAKTLLPKDPTIGICLARASYLTERFSPKVFMAEYQSAINLIWAKADPAETTFDFNKLTISAMAGKGDALFDKLSASEQGRLLLLTALEAQSKDIFAHGNTILAAQYLEKARDLFDAWKAEKIEVGSDYLFEQQLHYDLASFYMSWPMQPRFEDARKEYEIVKQLAGPNGNWWVEDQLKFLDPNVLGFNCSNGSWSAFFRTNLENGRLTVNLNKDGVAADAFLFTDPEKTRAIRLQLGVFSGGAWNAGVGLSQAKDNITLAAGVHASSDGQGDTILGFDVEATKRFDRFFSAGIRGHFDQHIGDYKYSEWELEAFAHYARRLAKGTTFYADLTIGIGQTAQSAWRDFFRRESGRAGNWTWTTVNGADVSVQTDTQTPSIKWSEDSWIKEHVSYYDPATGTTLPQTGWHVSTGLYTDQQTQTIDVSSQDDPEGTMEIAFKTQTMVGLAHYEGMSLRYQAGNSLHTNSDAEKPNPGDIDVRALATGGDHDPARPPMAIYQEYLKGVQKNGNETIITISAHKLRGGIPAGTWPTQADLIDAEAYKIRRVVTKYTSGAAHIIIYKTDLSVPGSAEEKIYEGGSVRDGNVAIERYVYARLSMGVEKQFPGGTVGIEVFGQMNRYWGHSDPTGNPSHTVDPNTTSYGLRLYTDKTLGSQILSGEIGWNHPDGFNWKVGTQILLGGNAGKINMNVPRFELGISSPGGVYAQFGTDRWGVGYYSYGFGASLSLGRDLAATLTNRGFGLSGPAGLALGSGGLSWSPIAAGVQCLTSYFFEIKPVRDKRHKLEAMLAKETEAPKRALLRYYIDSIRIKEESSRAEIGGDFVLLRFLGNNSHKAYKVINSEISAAIVDVRDKVAKGLDASENIAYLLLTFISSNKKITAGNVEIALLLSDICAKNESIKQFVIDLWKNMPAELKEKNKDADIMALIEAAKTPPGPKPQAKPADLPCLIGTKPARPYAGDEEIDSRTIVSRRITTLRHSLKVHVTATTVRREVVEDAVFLLSSASSVSKDYNIRRIAASLSELTEQERTEVKARLEADKTLLDNKVSYRPNGAEETVEFTLREFMEYSFNGTLEEEYKTAKH